MNRQVLALLATGAIVGLGIVFVTKSANTPPLTKNEVVVYVAHDQDYSQPILKKFEQETGVKVKAVYDTEASKTVGLTNRLMAEKSNPQADVFWNNEVINTIRLKEEGVLEAYKPENYINIPDNFKDKDGYWTGFAARARVLVVNSEKVGPAKTPNSILDLVLSDYKDKVTIADARFGTTGSHLGAIFAVMGEEKAKAYLLSLKQNGLNVAQSNGATRDKVVNGEEWIGFTDTDDANDALSEGKPVIMIYPDQGKNQFGTLVIPNTVAIIKGSKNTENAKKLIDYLVSAKTESALAKAKSAQMPLLPNVDTPDNVKQVKDIKTMDVTWQEIYKQTRNAIDFFSSEILPN